MNTAAKNAAAEERESDDLQKQLIEYENTIIALTNQLESKNDMGQSNSLNFIEKLYISLFSNPQISIEQTIILKRLCEITSDPINSIMIDEIRNKLTILESNDITDIEKGKCWEELDKFIRMHNIISLRNDASNIFGFSYPSGSTTPIPSPQFIEEFNSSNDLVTEPTYVTNNQHVIMPKKRNSRKINNYEPYPSGGHIAIRPSKKGTDMMVWHQNDPCEDVPIIVVHAPSRNKYSIKSTGSNETEFETLQNSNVHIPDESLQFSTSNLLLSPHTPYELDEIGQFSNATSPTISSSDSYNSISDEYPTFLSHSMSLNPVENWLFPNSSDSYDNEEHLIDKTFL